MKSLKKQAFFILTLVSVSLFSSCDMYSYVSPSSETSYENPSWAPDYYPGVRYYYLPDIETFYDLSDQEFVYLDNGQWDYSADLPPIYAGFDLNDCFVIAINDNTFEPWMHYQYYVSNYPRYYYRDYYDHSNIPYVRGFNENTESAFYWPENDRNRARRWDNENDRSDRHFNYSKSDRSHRSDMNANSEGTRRSSENINRGQQNNSLNTPQQNRSINPTPRTSVNGTGNRQEKPATPDRSSQRTNYYGRNIGQPVRVQRQMRQPAQTTTRERPSSRGNNNNNSREENNRR
jgi:hypothetical protein